MTVAYFNFTNSSTKIAHTPTVKGNCANAALCTNVPPLGRAKVKSIMHSAVNIPSDSLLFQVMAPSLFTANSIEATKLDPEGGAFNNYSDCQPRPPRWLWP